MDDSVAGPASEHFGLGYRMLLEGRHAEAATHFARAEAAFEASGEPGGDENPMTPWKLFCRGMELFGQAGREGDAHRFLANSRDLFVRQGQADCHRPAAFAQLVEAKQWANEANFERASACFEQAEETFRDLIAVQPDEEVEFRRLMYAARVEKFACRSLSAAKEAAHGEASARWVEMSRAVDDLLSLADTAPRFATFQTSYLLFVEAALQQFRARHLLFHFSVDAARAAFVRAASSFETAATRLSSLGVLPRVWQSQHALYMACMHDSGAGILASDAIGALLAGNHQRASVAGAEAVAAYEVVITSLAAAGPVGLQGLRASEVERDRMKGLLGSLRSLDHPSFAMIAQIPQVFADASLESRLRGDIDDLQTVYRAGVWRVVLILCGGILESLLIALVQRRWRAVQAANQQLAKVTKADVLAWNLGRLVETAGRARLISETTRLMSDSLREHRNLAHPGVEARGEFRIDEEVARSSLTILLIVVEAVGRR